MPPAPIGRGDPSPIVLACGTDERFAMPTAVTLFAALSRMSPARAVVVFVADGGMTPDSKRRMRRVLAPAGRPISLEIVPVEPKHFGPLPTPGHLSSAVYFRLLLPWIIPARHPKVIYLDGDLLVRHDLAALWDLPLEHHALLAARDVSAPVVSSRAALPDFRALGLDPHAPYLNSGVLVMNLDVWRRENLGTLVARYVADQGPNNRFGDQDGINAVLAGRWAELDARWNVPVYISQDSILRAFEPSGFTDRLRQTRGALLREARIYHFVGRAKPWTLGCALPGQMEWMDAARRSGWHHPIDPRPRAWRGLLRADRLLRIALRWMREARRQRPGLPSPAPRG